MKSRPNMAGAFDSMTMIAAISELVYAVVAII
jgi:hypothetical protein